MVLLYSTRPFCFYFSCGSSLIFPPWNLPFFPFIKILPMKRLTLCQSLVHEDFGDYVQQATSRLRVQNQHQNCQNKPGKHSQIIGMRSDWVIRNLLPMQNKLKLQLRTHEECMGRSTRKTERRTRPGALYIQHTPEYQRRTYQSESGENGIRERNNQKDFF